MMCIKTMKSISFQNCKKQNYVFKITQEQNLKCDLRQ